MIFLYPDLLTGIQGQFTNQGWLTGGRHGKVIGKIRTLDTFFDKF